MFVNDSDLLDQHFLINEEVIDNFISICNLNKNDIVLEIGPGKGVLTKKIIPLVKKTYLIEKDTRLKPFLESLDATITYGDVLEEEIPKVNKIITALPYSIIEPFMYKMIRCEFEELYMIMGSTYVYNVINRKINNLSLLTNTFFETYKYNDIGKENFDPKPNTMSSILKLVPKKEFKGIDKIFRLLYLYDNKKIKNTLIDYYMNEGLVKRESKEKVNSLGIYFIDKKFLELSNEELECLYNILNEVGV